jgi:hypothetical protein
MSHGAVEDRDRIRLTPAGGTRARRPLDERILLRFPTSATG